FTANVTASVGSAPATLSRTYELRSSGETVSVGAEAGVVGRSRSARRSTAETGGTVTDNSPVVPEVGLSVVPRSGDHADKGVEVRNESSAGAEPELNASTYSRGSARSMRLTTNVRPDPARTTVEPVDSAGTESRSAASAFSRTSIGFAVT